MKLIDKSYYEILSGWAKETPDREAVVMGDVRLTYSQFVKKIDNVASYLLGKGLQKGDKVALWSSASPAWLYTYYGIIRSGGIALILNANLTLQDAKALVEYADTRFMMYGKTHDVSGSDADKEVLVKTFGLAPENCVSINDEDFSDVKEVVIDRSSWTVHDDAYMIYTSGTTAFPKAVLTAQYALINVVDKLSDAISSVRGDKALLGVPLFHAYAIFVMWIYFSRGSTVIIPEAIKADIIANLIGREKATDLWSVATIYQGIIDDPALTGMVAENVRICSIAGSYTSPVQFMRFENALYKTTFINLYGMTETSATYTLTRPEDDEQIRHNTVGRAVEGIEACAWDEEHGILPPGEVGEIITRGYHLMNGYYKLPPEKQAIDKDGWLHSGDLGVFDEQGNLRIVGRIKDLIIKGGENLAPAEIEAQVMTHPSIGACRIFGYKDRIYGENLGACVTLTPGCAFEEEEVRRYVKAKVGSYKSPVYYFVFDAFPLNANGKVDQRHLHIEMLKRLHKMRLEGKLEKGMPIITMTLKNSSYNITPVAVLFEECAANIGFSRAKAMEIHQAVEELLVIAVNETDDSIGDIDVSMQYMQNVLRLSVVFTDMHIDWREDRTRIMAGEILLKLVDDIRFEKPGGGKVHVNMDFTYDKEFDIRDFLLKHEKIE